MILSVSWKDRGQGFKVWTTRDCTRYNRYPLAACNILLKYLRIIIGCHENVLQRGIGISMLANYTPVCLPYWWLCVVVFLKNHHTFSHEGWLRNLLINICILNYLNLYRNAYYLFIVHPNIAYSKLYVTAKCKMSKLTFFLLRNKARTVDFVNDFCKMNCLWISHPHVAVLGLRGSRFSAHGIWHYTFELIFSKCSWYRLFN